jgi:hypothetical protein
MGTNKTFSLKPEMRQKGVSTLSTLFNIVLEIFARSIGKRKKEKEYK